MKRKSFGPLAKKVMVAVPAAAMMLGASHGGQIGINFQDNYAGTPYAPLTDTSAFGIPLANWFNAPSVFNSDGTPFSTSATYSVPGAGDLKIVWSAKNTWSLYAAVPTAGDDQVIYGYLDDTDYGYTATLSGLRAFASDFTITTIASSDSAAAFQDATLISKTDSNSVQYLNNYTPSYASGLAGTSTVSSVFLTLNGNDSVTIRGLPRAGTARSTLAGILLSFTPGTNAPLVETQPQAVTNGLFPGGAFSLSATASGTPAFGYQWRKNGSNVSGATDATYSKSNVVVGDSGNYDLVVTNAYGSATSAVAVVTVQNVIPPIITQAPVSQSFYAGYSATFTVVATGGQLTYQWKLNNVNISGATNATYSISSITTNNAGTYTILVNNPVGPVASASATLAVKVAAPGSYEAALAQTKPLLWFRDNEVTPRLVVTGTATNTGSTGTADNGVAKYYTVFQQPGSIVGDTNKSAAFSGGQAIDVPFDSALNPATFTVELWAMPNAVDSSLGAQSPLYNRGTALGDGWLFWANNGTTKWQFRTYTGTTRNTVNSTDPAVAGVWTHLVGTYDGTTTHFYVNGVEQGTGLAGAFTPNGGIPLRFGGAGNDTGASGVNAWNGGVDEVAIYGTVLSPAVILSHYQNATNSARGTAYDSLIQASTPVGYWRLNDPSGPTAPKPQNSGTLGSAWTGSYAGDVAPFAAGPQPPTYPGFESTNYSVAMTNGWNTCPQLPIGTNTVTLTCWLKRAATFTTGDLGWPAWLGGGGMHLNNGTQSGQGPYAEIRYHWNGAQWDWGSGLVVPADTWTFCVMVVEPTKATFYMSDGGTLRTSVHTATHANMSVTSVPGFGGNQPGRADRTYMGQIDESAVYDRALTQTEIDTLFLVGTGAPFQLSIVPGGIIQDSKPVGTSHNGTNNGAFWLASSTDTAAVPLTRNGVEKFATTNSSQIVIPADPDFDSSTGTIAFWMRADAPLPGPGNEGAMLMDHRTTNGTVIVLNDAGSIFVQCSGGANSFSSGYLPDGNWHHVAVTYDQSASGLVTIYVDGVLSGSQANTSAWAWPSARQIELGRSHDAYWRRFDGLMDDFRIYNRVLTASEVSSVAASDALVDTSALKVRYNFGTSGIGNSVFWPFGTLYSSPVLGPSAVWTPVPGATAPVFQFLPASPAQFFRATP